MKVFTVLTAVFLPLTLIVGWFGMNVKMPEYSWNYGYLYVIVLSITVCGICGWIFKKKKWF
jgi:magnesium transporter